MRALSDTAKMSSATDFVLKKNRKSYVGTSLGEYAKALPEDT